MPTPARRATPQVTPRSPPGEGLTRRRPAASGRSGGRGPHGRVATTWEPSRARHRPFSQLVAKRRNPPYSPLRNGERPPKLTRRTSSRLAPSPRLRKGLSPCIHLDRTRPCAWPPGPAAPRARRPRLTLAGHHPGHVPDDHPGRHIVITALPEHPPRSSASRRPGSLGPERLHPDLRRPAPARRPGRRHPRPPPGLRGRHRPVHRRLAARGPGPVGRPGCCRRPAVQGIGAAIAAPSTLALLTDQLPEGPERARAIGPTAPSPAGRQHRPRPRRRAHQLGALALGASSTCPSASALIFLAPRDLPESERRHGHFDLAGGAPPRPSACRPSSTASSAPLGRSGDVGHARLLRGRGHPARAFLITESGGPSSRSRPCTSSPAASGSAPTAPASSWSAGCSPMFFFLTQFLQGVRDYSALERRPAPSCR